VRFLEDFEVEWNFSDLVFVSGLYAKNSDEVCIPSQQQHMRLWISNFHNLDFSKLVLPIVTKYTWVACSSRFIETTRKKCCA